VISRKVVAGTLVLALVIALSISFRPDRAIRVATGVVAHNVCSKFFVSGLDSQTAFAESSDRAGIRSLRWGLSYDLDRVSETVSVSLVGLFRNRATFREGLGCVLLLGPKEPYRLTSNIAALKKPSESPLLRDFAGPARVEPSDPKLKAALDHAFEERPSPPFRRIKAVVVVHNGAVIGERYADGISIDTPLLGYSLTKSVVNALIGILTREGRLSPSWPAPIADWRVATDSRHAIEIQHLMRMTSGLALDETDSGFDPSSQAIYLHNDTAGFAAKADIIAPPGIRWAYSSASTQLLARIICDIVGGPEQTLAFAWRELFNPLGMQNVTLEFDGAGTFQGSIYMLASARDWARFGLLYLNDGKIRGLHILPAGWVDFSASATLDTDYGAGFWTNRGEQKHAKGRVRMGIPADAFFAHGALGQRIVVLPSQRLVIVRLGDSADPSSDNRDLGRLVREVIAATQN
jgi:CubicO group peptidase (beta-lactamase class C family)